MLKLNYLFRFVSLWFCRWFNDCIKCWHKHSKGFPGLIIAGFSLAIFSLQLIQSTNFSYKSYLIVFQSTSNDDVDDGVRDMWKATQTDPNIPPLLTMPGIQSPTELVHYFFQRPTQNLSSQEVQLSANCTKNLDHSHHPFVNIDLSENFKRILRFLSAVTKWISMFVYKKTKFSTLKWELQKMHLEKMHMKNGHFVKMSSNVWLGLNNFRKETIVDK